MSEPREKRNKHRRWNYRQRQIERRTMIDALEQIVFFAERGDGFSLSDALLRARAAAHAVPELMDRLKQHG